MIHCREDYHSQSSHHNTDHYQPFPRQYKNRNPTFPKEPKIDLPPFHGREDVEEYLDWKMKVDKFLSGTK